MATGVIYKFINLSHSDKLNVRFLSICFANSALPPGPLRPHISLVIFQNDTAVYFYFRRKWRTAVFMYYFSFIAALSIIEFKWKGWGTGLLFLTLLSPLFWYIHELGDVLPATDKTCDSELGVRKLWFEGGGVIIFENRISPACRNAFWYDRFRRKRGEYGYYSPPPLVLLNIPYCTAAKNAGKFEKTIAQQITPRTHQYQEIELALVISYLYEPAHFWDREFLPTSR